jgi:hypothetical protein
MELIRNKGSSVVLRTGAIYRLVAVNGVWKLLTRSGTSYTARGTFNFVRRSGVYWASKRGEHIHISRGMPVEYAGAVRFGYNRDNRGKLKSWSNASGHYIPPPSLASQAGLPMDLFVPIEAP